MLQRKLHGSVDEDATLEFVGLDDQLDHIEGRVKLVDGPGTAALANHDAKGMLQPAVLLLERSQHQIVFALEMLVKSGLANTHVGQNLVDAHATKAIAIKTANGRVNQVLARGRFQWHRMAPGRRLTTSQPKVYHESTYSPVVLSDTHP